MGDEIDIHIGKRARRRRRLLGLTQLQVAAICGVRFQQIQKYECGANRLSAARLWRLAKALDAPVSYFFDGLDEAAPATEGDQRRRLLDLSKTLNGESDAA